VDDKDGQAHDPPPQLARRDRAWRIGRRNFLKSMLVSPALIAGLCRVATGEEGGQPLLLAMDGLSARTDPGRLRAFLAPFEARKLKIGVVIGSTASDMAHLAAVCAEAIHTRFNIPSCARQLSGKFDRGSAKRLASVEV
jgi:hypothetical protein